VEATVEVDAEEEVEVVGRAAETAPATTDLPGTVSLLKNFFPCTADMPIKEAIEAIERQTFGKIMPGSLPQRTNALAEIMLS
jgi:hypothetical protein